MSYQWANPEPEGYASYGWIITAEHLGSEPDAVGVMGPHNIAPKIERDLKAGKGQAFRLYDDDGELYYSGRALALCDDAGNYEAHFTDADETAAFGPLWDYGTPNAGATDLRYFDSKTHKLVSL